MRSSVFVALSLFLCLTVPAVPSQAKTQPITVKATVLVASNEGSDFNLDNDAYRDQLIELFSYSAYEQVDIKALKLGRGKRVKMALVGEFELMLTLQGEENGRVLVQALIRKGTSQYVNTVLSILNPGVVFLGGPEVPEGALIIVLETGF